MTVQPLHNQVLIRPLIKEKSEGGVVLPAEEVRNVRIAEVVAVGRGTLMDGIVQQDGQWGVAYAQSEVKAGDKVYYENYSALLVEIDGAKHLLVSENEIRAIVRD